MFNGQGGYQPPPAWQQGFNHAPQRTGPPPAKKARGNPIITRYPPPPGYKGPAQPQVPFQQQAYPQQPAWQPSGQPYSYGPTPYSGYPNQAYGAPQAYQQPSFPGYPAQPQYPPTQHASPTYPPQTWYQPPVHSQTYPTPQPPAWQYQPPPPQSVPPQHWTPPSTVPQKRRHHSAPSLDQRTGSVDLSTDAIPEESETHEELDDDDFLGECYFASHPEDIDPDFSLGFILWKAPLPTKRALPSTWAEAELEALAPRKPLPTDDESISDYFIKEKRHEALLSVRQTDYWAEMKDDPLFKDLPVICSDIISMSELLEKYKNRSDATWSAPPFSPTPDPEGELSNDANGGAMDLDEQTPSVRSASRDDQSEQTDVLGNLEQALQRNAGNHNRHSRASSTASISSQKITRPTPLMPVRDQTQENILAALGVTGSPKLVYQTPGPAVNPVHQREGSLSRSSRHNSVTSNNGSSQVPPPPPPPPPGHPPNQRSTSSNSFHGNGSSNRNGYSSERRGSNASHHTAAGSDFNSDDQDATPRPKFNRTDNRKRSHDSESDTPDDRRRQDEDETPRQRRKQQRTDDPWSARRW